MSHHSENELPQASTTVINNVIYQFFFDLFNLLLKGEERFCQVGKSLDLSLVCTLTKEALLKGMVQYSLPPCTNHFKSAAFYYANMIQFFAKEADLGG
jgi:hypothetical protein